MGKTTMTRLIAATITVRPTEIRFAIASETSFPRSKPFAALPIEEPIGLIVTEMVVMAT